MEDDFLNGLHNSESSLKSASFGHQHLIYDRQSAPCRSLERPLTRLGIHFSGLVFPEELPLSNEQL